MATLRWLLDQPLKETKLFLFDLLGEPKDANRVQAILCLSKKLSHDELEQILEEYVARDSYFYNVACWLDRILYAPTLSENYLYVSLSRFSKNVCRKTSFWRRPPSASAQNQTKVRQTYQTFMLALY